jgi:2-polyprenyl-3-methyl-5-hydroxy-6-metoxy-1,4-benzoquinol methylase
MMKKCPLCRGKVVHRFGLEHTAVWECTARDCNLLFADPQLDDRNLALAYAKHYYPSNGDGGSAAYENTPDEITRQVFAKAEAEMGPLAGKNLLDFGCGVGRLCRIAAEQSICTVGIEPDSNARDKASKTGGLSVYPNLADLREGEPEAKFDILTMWDVIEHLREPWKELEDLSTVLQPDGWLLLSTPNASSLRAHLQRERWENTANPTHFYYFTRMSLKAVLRRAGFTEITELQFPIRYPGHAIIRRIVHRALVSCHLQGQLVFIARPRIPKTAGGIRGLEDSQAIGVYAAD